MTSARIIGGGIVHFPPYGTLKDSISVIEPPPADDLPGIARQVHPSELLLFARRLIGAARKRSRSPRWEKVNCSRLELARLCIERALADTCPKPPELHLCIGQ